MPDGNNNIDTAELQNLYGAVSKKFEVGTFDEFTSKMNTKEKRQRFYNVASEQFDIGDYNTFEQRLLKKKEPTPTPALAGELPSREPEQLAPITEFPEVAPAGISTTAVAPVIERKIAEEPVEPEVVAEPAPLAPMPVPEITPEPPTEVPTGLPIGETPLQEQREFLLQRTAEAEMTDADRIKRLLEKGEPTGELTFMDKIGEIETINLIPFLSGANEAAQMIELLQAANRLDDDTASDSDVLLLLEFINKGKQETSFWYDVMNVVAEMPAFAGELLATGGIYTGIKKATIKGSTGLLKKLLREGGEKLVKKKATKITTAIAGGIAGGTVQAPIAGITRIWAGTYKNMMPEFELTIDEQNQITGSITKPGDNVYLAAVKAFGDQWVETVSEKSGGLFRAIGRAGKEVMLRHGLLRGFLKANPKAKVSDFMNIVRRAGYDGVIAEMLEERVAEIGRATLNLGEWELPTPKQLAVELVSFSIPGLSISAANMATTKGKIKYETGEAAKEIGLPEEVTPEEVIEKAPEVPKVPVEEKPPVVEKPEIVEKPKVEEVKPPEKIPEEAPPEIVPPEKAVPEEVPPEIEVEQPITETTFKKELGEEFIEGATIEKPITTKAETPERTLTYDYYTETTPEGEVKYLKKLTGIEEKVIPERMPPEKVPVPAPPIVPPAVPKVPAKPLEIVFREKVIEATKQTEIKLKPSEREFKANIKDIDIDVDRFQNRDEEYSQETVDRIIKEVEEGTYNEAIEDPILLWKDPKDNKFKILGGHSRLKAHQILSEKGITEFNEVYIREVRGWSEKQAIEFATERSNTMGTQESYTERANIYRKMREKGISETKITEKAKEGERDNWVFVTNLSNLNPAGKAITAVKSFARSTDIEGRQKIQAIADWTGEIKKRFPDLSNLHEDEIHDFLIDAYSKTKQAGKVSNKQAFISLAETVIDRAKTRGEFSADRLINFKNFIGRSPHELEYDNQLAEAKKKVDDFRKESDDKRADLILRKATSAEMDKILKPFEDKLRRAIKDLTELRKQKGLVKEATRKQTSIFDEVEELKQKKEVSDDKITEVRNAPDDEITRLERLAKSIEVKTEVAGKAEEIEAGITEVDDAISKPITVKLEAPELATLLEQAERGADIRSEFREALGRHLKIIEPAKQEAIKKLWKGKLSKALEKGEVKIAEVEKEIPRLEELDKLIDKEKGNLGDALDDLFTIGITGDVRSQKEKVYNAHKSMVKLAGLYIEKGIRTAAEFAKELGYKLNLSIQKAWDDAMAIREDKKPSITSVEDITPELIKRTFEVIPKVPKEKIEPEYIIKKGKKHQFQNKEFNKRYTDSVIQQPKIINNVKKFFIQLWHKSTRTIESLPKTARFADFLQGTSEFLKANSIAQDKTVRHIADILGKMTPEEVDLFTKKVILQDLKESITIDENYTLPWDLTPETLKSELDLVNKYVDNNPSIKGAIGKRKIIWEEIKNEYKDQAKKSAISIDGKFDRDEYFRHQVLYYASTVGSIGSGVNLRKPRTRSFFRKRVGGEGLDINRDYIQAEFEVMSRLLYDTHKMEYIKRVSDEYDIMPKLREEAKKELGKEVSTQDTENYVQDNLPEGYELYAPDKGHLFFMAQSVPAHISEELMQNASKEIGITAEDLKNIRAMSGAGKKYVLPTEIVDSFDEVSNKDRTRMKQYVEGAFSESLKAWKIWILTSPRRAIKYNFRNVTGDAEAGAIGNVAGFSKVPQAIKELYDVYYRNKVPTATMKEFLDRGGLSVTATVQEIGELNKLRPLMKYYEKKESIPIRLWRRYWSFVKIATDYREQMLRYANFIDYIKQIETTGNVKNYGASKPSIIDALNNKFDKAFRLSNELLGAYDEISVAGKTLRKYWMPFWSFQEINIKRTNQFFLNAINNKGQYKEGKFKGVMRVAAIKSPFIAWRLAKLTLKMSGLWAATQVWNQLVFPDEEEELQKEIRKRPHIIFGRNADGSIRAFTRIGVIGDYLEWFGLDAAPNDIGEVINGRMEWKELVTNMIQAPFIKLTNAINPFVKTTAELATRRATYPNVFKPRTIRDYGQHIARNFGLANEYNGIKGLPTRGYLKSWRQILWYDVEPMQSAYYESQSLKRKFQKKKGRESDGFWISKKGNALYYYKQSLAYGDAKMAKKFLDEYITLGGTQKGLEQSIKSLHPLYGVKKEEAEFMEFIGKDGREVYNKALEYYEKILSVSEKDVIGEEKVPTKRRVVKGRKIKGIRIEGERIK